MNWAWLPIRSIWDSSFSSLLLEPRRRTRTQRGFLSLGRLQLLPNTSRRGWQQPTANCTRAYTPWPFLPALGLRLRLKCYLRAQLTLHFSQAWGSLFYSLPSWRFLLLYLRAYSISGLGRRIGFLAQHTYSLYVGYLRGWLARLEFSSRSTEFDLPTSVVFRQAAQSPYLSGNSYLGSTSTENFQQPRLGYVF
jgi:hypothetical protein